jgi:hypothetical protein
MTRLANVAGTCGIAPHVERLVLAEQVTIALADLATAFRDGLSGWPELLRLTRDEGGLLMVKEDGWMMAAPQNYLAVIIVRMEPIAFRVVDRCGSGC